MAQTPPAPDPSIVELARRVCRELGEFTLKDVMTRLALKRPEAEAAMNALFRAGEIKAADKLRGEWTLWIWFAPPPSAAPGASARPASVPAVPAAQPPAMPRRYAGPQQHSPMRPGAACLPARGAAKDDSHPQVRYWAKASGTLYWVAAILGVACILDTLHQSFSQGLWLPFEPLYYLFGKVSLNVMAITSDQSS